MKYKVNLETIAQDSEFFIKTEKSVEEIEKYYTDMFLTRNIEIIPVPDCYYSTIKVFETI